jgi:hypothetical protein
MSDLERLREDAEYELTHVCGPKSRVLIAALEQKLDAMTDKAAAAADRAIAAQEAYNECAEVLNGHCQSCGKPYMAIRYQPAAESGEWACPPEKREGEG